MNVDPLNRSLPIYRVIGDHPNGPSDRQCGTIEEAHEAALDLAHRGFHGVTLVRIA